MSRAAIEGRTTIGDHTTRVAAGTSVALLGRGASSALKYFTQAALAWLLGPAAFGLYSLAFAFYQLASLLPALGLESGSVRHVALYRSAHDYARLKGVLQLSYWLPIFVGLPIAVVLFWQADAIAEIVFEKEALGSVLRYFAIALPFGAAMLTGAFATTGFKTVRYQVMTTDLFQPIVNLGLIFILIALGWGVYGAAAAWLLSVIAGFLLVGVFTTRLWRGEHAEAVARWEPRELLGFSLPLMLSSLSWICLLWTDVLFLGVFGSTADVGIYRAASQTALLITILLSSLAGIFSPIIAELQAKGDRDQLQELFRTATRWSVLCSLPIFIVLGVAGDDVLRIFGEHYVAGYSALLILSIGNLISAGAGSLGPLLMMSGRQYDVLAGDLAVFVANVVLNWLLAPRWGLVGAAIATSASIVLLNAIRHAQVRLLLKLQPYDARFFKPFIAGGAAVAAAYVADHLSVDAPFALRLPSVALATGTVFVLTIVTLGMDDSDHAVLRAMKKAIR